MASCVADAAASPESFDRIPIIAAARGHDLTIITRNRAIRADGNSGHVKTLAF